MNRQFIASVVMCLALAVVSGSATRVDAAWQQNGTPVCTAPGWQFSPAVFSDGAHGAVIHWYNEVSFPAADIYSQRIDSSGVITWASSGVLVATSSQWFFCMPNADGAGGILYGLECPGASSTDICVKQVTAAGTLQPRPLACGEGSEQWYPWIAPSVFGVWCDAYVVWEDYRGGQTRVYMQGLDAGNVLWPDGLLVGGAPDADVHSQRVLGSEDGAGIVVWADKRNGDWDIFAQCVLPPQGNQIWGDEGLTVYAGSGNQRPSGMVTDGNLGVVIIWRDDAKHLYAQRVQANGWVWWDAPGVTVSAGTAEWENLIYDGRGGTIVAWQEGPNTAPRNIRVQRINADGELEWGPNGVLLAPSSTSSRAPVVRTDGAGGAIAAWTELRGGNYGVYVQRVDSSGAVLWDEGGIALRELPSAVSGCGVASDGANGAIVVWDDERSDRGDIYAARVSGGGGITGIGDRPAAGPLVTRMEQNVPNPFNPTTRIRYDLASRVQVSLGVYDVSGQFIKHLASAVAGPGTFTTEWDGTNENGERVSSGVYFCRLKAGSFVETKKMILLK